MIRDEIIGWLLAAVIGAALGCVVILVVGLAVVTSYGAGAKYGKKEAERRERVEWRCWNDEWAETRAAQERYLEERGQR